ncbi:MAG: carboxy terminal-processing peptidase [Chitinophagaceae bacterium]
MLSRFTIIFLFGISYFTSSINAQNLLQKNAENAFLITKMADKFHVQPKPVDDAFSQHIFHSIFSELDHDKIIFTQANIQSLQVFQTRLDDEIKLRKTDFLTKLLTLYKQQIILVDTTLTLLAKKPFNLYLSEKITVTEDTTYAINDVLLQQKIAKYCKQGVLNYVASYWLDSAKPLVQKKFVDSIEPIARKKIITSVKRSFSSLLQQANAIEKELMNVYCNVVAQAYDPHSSFFTADAKTNFENQLGKKPLRFGFSLDEDDDGSVAIRELKPGSPAYKSGLLNAGDKVIAVQWEGKESITVADKGAEFISNLLEGNTNNKLTLSVRKADGTIQSVILQKQEIDNGEEDDSKVKSFVLKGAKSIGYISLPAFYEDWASNEIGINGAANDIGKEILKLKKENIQGLIIDVRYNGGGSMQEAIELAGIFIDAGPVGQVKSREPKPYTLKDANRGTLYDGPLVVMVNGYSASASEMLAGTLQDYHRAVIVGSPTFGKATAQIILPLDTTVSLDKEYRSIKAEAYVKITISSLYRVTGKTAQGKGVQPDIILPDLLSVNGEREADQQFSLIVNDIEPNKYYKPYTPISMNVIKATAQAEVTNSSVFSAIQEKITQLKIKKVEKDISLFLTDFIAEYKKVELADEEDEIEVEKNKLTSNFSIISPSFYDKQISSTTKRNLMNEQWINFLSKDPYIKTSFEVLVKMIP